MSVNNIPDGLPCERDALDKEIADLKNKLTPFVMYDEEVKEMGFADIGEALDHLRQMKEENR